MGRMFHVFSPFIRMLVFSSLLTSFLLATSKAKATIILPQNLSKNDRISVTQIIGLGTSSKILSDPYPLGGYAGFEAGFSIESIPADDLARLGNGFAPAQSAVTLPKLTIGKGLYNNIDMFLSFAPYTSQDELSQYGGILRWGFYQSPSLPLSLSTSVNVNSADISNKLATHSYGVDVMGGMNVDRVALFAGLGYAEALGTFLGGASGLTDSKNEETEVATGLHTVVGVDIRIADVFVALQVDRYTVSVFSGKLGMRF